MSPTLCKTDDIIGERYLLGNIIGRGATGIVFHATDRKTSMPVAAKVLAPECLQDDSTRRRFEREARLATKLHHPNTIRILDSGITDQGLPFIIMEYLNGTPLRDIIETQKIIAPQRVARILIQILSSLAEAHKYNIIHRDIKPSNIMIIRDSEGEETVKILDFGVSTVIVDEGLQDNNINATRSLDVVGTPKYMAPELFRGEPLTTASDLYSVGCIGYEMLSGFPPFCAPTLHMTIANHLFLPPPPFDQDLIDNYPLLTDAILKLLAKNQGERFARAQDAIDAISGLVSAKDIAMLADNSNETLCMGISDVEDSAMTPEDAESSTKVESFPLVADIKQSNEYRIPSGIIKAYNLNDDLVRNPLFENVHSPYYILSTFMTNTQKQKEMIFTFFAVMLTCLMTFTLSAFVYEPPRPVTAEDDYTLLIQDNESTQKSLFADIFVDNFIQNFLFRSQEAAVGNIVIAISRYSDESPPEEIKKKK